MHYPMDSDAVVQFAGITGSTDNIAAQYVRLADGNLEQAIELYFANDGAALETSPNPPANPQPDPSTRRRENRHGFQEEGGVINLDSDNDDQDYVDEDDDEIEVTNQRRRDVPPTTRPTSTSRTAANARPSVEAALDDDEAMARRLQEEYYGAAGRNGNVADGNSEMLDEHGYRAPIARTTETLVGPGSMDPTNAEEMRAAVMEQMMARRQQPRHRGKLITLMMKPLTNDNVIRSTWNLQPGHSTLNMEQCRQSP